MNDMASYANSMRKNHNEQQPGGKVAIPLPAEGNALV
jgi:hypothetical protein